MAKHRILVLMADEKELELREVDGSLQTSQEIVGGYLEVIRLNHGIDLWINEEGKLMDLSPNFLLTNPRTGYSDLIVGNVFFSSANQSGDNISLTDEQIDYIKEKLQANRRYFIIR